MKLSEAIKVFNEMKIEADKKGRDPELYFDVEGAAYSVHYVTIDSVTYDPVIPAMEDMVVVNTSQHSVQSHGWVAYGKEK